jgi:digeranylgeranylglycerophospholipid reductase
MTDFYDVIVIGAGPAGSTAAKFAAQGGAKTILLEKHPVIGYPLCCAEAISLTGLKRVVEPDRAWISSKIEKVIMVSPDGTAATIRHPDAGYVLERKIFDRELAKQAADNGAHVRVGCDVVDLIRGNNNKITGVIACNNGAVIRLSGKVIIAADGVESKIARLAGMATLVKPRQMHSAYQYLLADLDIAPETIEFHFGNKIAPGGYIWIFNKGGGMANVGIGICPLKSPVKKAIEYLDRFIKRRFKKYQILERMTGGVPSYSADYPLYKDNILVAGDAARVVDSLTGAGIANALLSGKIAGQTAVDMINNVVTAENYAREFNSLKQKELKFYYYCREIYLKMTDDDLISVLKFAGDLFGDREVLGINPFEIVKKILLVHPRLLKLGRHLIL